MGNGGCGVQLYQTRQSECRPDHLCGGDTILSLPVGLRPRSEEPLIQVHPEQVLHLHEEEESLDENQRRYVGSSGVEAVSQDAHRLFHKATLERAPDCRWLRHSRFFRSSYLTCPQLSMVTLGECTPMRTDFRPTPSWLPPGRLTSLYLPKLNW